jgi:hypothetical protein
MIEVVGTAMERDSALAVSERSARAMKGLLAEEEKRLEG